MKKYIALGIVVLALVFWGARYFLLSQNQAKIAAPKEPIDLISNTETLIYNNDIVLLDENQNFIELTETKEIQEYEAVLSEDDLTAVIAGKEANEYKIWIYENKKQELVALSKNTLDNLSISPQKTKIAYREVDSETQELYIYDREQKTSKRVSSEAQEAHWIDEHQLVFRDSQNNLIHTESETQNTIATNVSSFFIKNGKIYILQLKENTWNIKVINTRGEETENIFDLQWGVEYTPYNLVQVDSQTYFVRRFDNSQAQIHEIWEINLSHQTKSLWNQNIENFLIRADGQKIIERNNKLTLLTKGETIEKEFENYTIGKIENTAKIGEGIFLQKTIPDLTQNGFDEEFTLRYDSEKAVFIWSIVEGGNDYYEEIAYFYPIEINTAKKTAEEEPFIYLKFQNPNHNHKIIWNGITVEKKLEK